MTDPDTEASTKAGTEPSSSSRAPRWARANRWYLVALAVLVPAAILVSLHAGYWEYLEGRDGRPVAVTSGEPVDYSGATWTLTDWQAYPADSAEGQDASLFPGTTLLAATVDVEPGTVGPGCSVELLDASGERVWQTASYDLAVYERAEDTIDYCDSEAEEPYRLQVHFVIPDDAVEGARLRLWSSDSLPALLLLQP